MKRIKVFILLLIVSVLLSSCQGEFGIDDLQFQQYGADNSAEQYNDNYDILDKGPVAGGVLNLFTTYPDTLNPILTKSTYTSEFLGFIYEGLTQLNDKQEAISKLSDHWSVSADGLVWNFHIREGVKWQDGQPFTAEDVEFTIQTLLTPGIESVYKPLLRNITTTTAVDRSNIKLVLEKPNSFTPEMMNFPILPKHQFKQQDVLSAPKNFKPIGTGPYKYLSQNENKIITLKADINWWYLNAEDKEDKDTKETKEGMYIETININIYNNPNEAMEALQSGEIDVVGIDASDFQKYRGRTDLIVKKYTSRDFEFLSFNLMNPVIKDKNTRKAITLAINRDDLINDILLGEAVASEMPILPDSWISDNEGISTGTELLTPREILLEGGWKESEQGFYKMIGGIRKYLRVELLVNMNNSLRVHAAQKICSQLNKAGITAICTQVEWGEFLSRLGTSKYEIAFTGCRIPQIPDLSYLFSSNYMPVSLPAQYESATNVSGYSNLRIDEYIKSLFNENNTERKKEIYKDAVQLILDDSPYLGLYFMRNAMVYSKNIRGYLNPYTWNRYNGIEQWYKPDFP